MLANTSARIGFRFVNINPISMLQKRKISFLTNICHFAETLRKKTLILKIIIFCTNFYLFQCCISEKEIASIFREFLQYSENFDIFPHLKNWNFQTKKIYNKRKRYTVFYFFRMILLLPFYNCLFRELSLILLF